MLTKKTIKIIEEIGWGQKWRQKGRQEGLQEGLQGLQKGLQEGIQKTQLKTARALLAEGDSLAKISRVTGISVKTLKKELSTQ